MQACARLSQGYLYRFQRSVGLRHRVRSIRHAHDDILCFGFLEDLQHHATINPPQPLPAMRVTRGTYQIERPFVRSRCDDARSLDHFSTTFRNIRMRRKRSKHPFYRAHYDLRMARFLNRLKHFLVCVLSSVGYKGRQLRYLDTRPLDASRPISARHTFKTQCILSVLTSRCYSPEGFLWSAQLQY
jgi:hypothetical protein